MEQPAAMTATFQDALEGYAESLAADVLSRIPAQPEDQLKAPVRRLLERTGALLKRQVASRTEAQVEGLGARPDVGVEVNGLLTGHVELKAPGKGGRAERLKGSDREQWKKFQSLPNLIYTDGLEWSLYRTGDRVRGPVRIVPEDLVREGPAALVSAAIEPLHDLLQDFLGWNPVAPASPRGLAEALAPLCRLLRDDVLAAVDVEGSAIHHLAGELREALFPDADDAQFADAYAQTITYALLLARFEGTETITTSRATEALDRRYGLLARTLQLLSGSEVRKEIGLGVELLARVIDGIDPAALARRGDDPWLYFYEDFLAAYDRRLRKDRGVYYTPKEVIQAQCRLVAQLLDERFGKSLAFADDGVITLDPAAGTGAYVRAALALGMDRVREERGPGLVPGRATIAARNLHAFELLVGPYAVAHLRVTQGLRDHGGEIPSDGVHVYLTDTLESPHAAPKETQIKLSYLHRPLADEHRRAQKVKSEARVLVCLGNPPYDRQQIAPDEEGKERKGGWVRYGEGQGEGTEQPILEDFLRPVRDAGEGVHLKNLYNDYVYFWRWALWKVFESTPGSTAGIVSFITASSYLRGPGFLGMRKVMREVFDDLWIVDLEGDQLGARKTENVFAIRTPVAIAVGVRYGEAQPETPARARYTKITGDREAKLGVLSQIEGFEDLEWRDCYADWTKPFLPAGEGDYFAWPGVTDLFPWQQPGLKAGRSWPISPEPKVLGERWKALARAPKTKRARLFKDSPTGRKAGTLSKSLVPPPTRADSIRDMGEDAPCPPFARLGFRVLDRQWVLADGRLLDRSSPSLWLIQGQRQVFLSSLLTNSLGEGPAALATALIPDLHHFRGSFGGKDVLPLWRDASAKEPNVTAGLLEHLADVYGRPVAPADFFAYAYGILASPAYADRFSEELAEPGPRLPLTKEGELFETTAGLGRRLVFLHTYGERFVPEGETPGRIPRGRARCTKAIPESPDAYPEKFAYDENRHVLQVGDGEIAPVEPAVWELSVSGFEVVRSWLAYRMKDGAGKKSSPLDDIRPERWTAEMTEELLRLLWIVEATVEMFPTLEENLDRVIGGELFEASELPEPSDEERQPPKVDDEPEEIQLEIGDG
ncbi:MAG: type ISP restriction/modification enzyme [bacterium]